MQDIIIKEKKTKLILYLLLSILMFLGGLWVLLDGGEILIGLLATVFFGISTFFIFLRFFHNKILRIGKEGITDEINYGFISWDEIEAIYETELVLEKFIGIEIKDYEKLFNRISSIKIKCIKTNLGLGYPPITITLKTSNKKISDVLPIMQERLLKYRSENKITSIVDNNEDIVKLFWNYFDEAKFDEAATLIKPTAIISWCNTKEIFNRDNFILVNKNYPGHRRISLIRILSKDNLVISVVKVECENNSVSLYATSFFIIGNGKINKIEEYIGQNGKIPEWRTNLNLSISDEKLSQTIPSIQESSSKFSSQNNNYSISANNENVVKSFWKFLDKDKFNEAANLMGPTAIITMCNTREIFNRENFMIVNQNYPGSWKISINKILSKDDLVISVVKVESEDYSESLYITSFFMIKNGKIVELEEYRGKNGEIPEWRANLKLSEVY